MRLYRRSRGGIWYIEYSRGNAHSLKTKDEKEAKRRFKVLERNAVLGKLVKLEGESGITLGEFKAEYLKYRAGMSAKTLKHDALALGLLEDVAGPDTPLASIDAKKIDEFKVICLTGKLSRKKNPTPLKPVSVNSYLRQIKSALSSAVTYGYIKLRPKITMLSTGKKIPRYLRPEQIKAILAKAAELHPDFVSMLNFYLWTGARRNEALTLTWQNVRLNDATPTAILTGKGNRQRIVPLAPELIRLLKPMRKDSGFVFHRIHESTVTHWFHAIALACDPPISARLHDFRHSAATYMLASGLPLTMVQEILGHADLSTTAKYLDVIKEHYNHEIGKLKFDF